MSDLAGRPAVRDAADPERVEHRGDAPSGAYPVAPMQLAMLLQSQRDPGAGLYVQQYVCTLREPLRVAELHDAWGRLAARHSVLRTSFHLDASPEPLQRVHPRVRVPWAEQDWRGMPEEAREEAMRTFLREDRSTPFHPEDAPLTRLTLLRMEDEVYRLVWTSHHALMDGHARAILLRELFEDYEAEVGGREFRAADRRSYGAYVLWLRGAERPDSPSFWEEELRGFEGPNELTLEPARHGGAGTHRFRLSAGLTERLRRLARRENTTLNGVLQGAWALLLGRYTGDEDVVFGATRRCRAGGFEGAEGVVGLLSNTVPVRARMDPGHSVARHLRSVRSLWVRMRPHERTHLSRIQQWSAVPGGTPLFHTLLVFETEHTQDALHRLGEGWRRRSFELLQSTGYPLTVVAHGGARLSFALLFDGARFGGEAIRRLGEHLTLILRAFAADPGQPLGRIEILTPAERRRLVEERPAPAALRAAPACIHTLLQAQAARTPDAVAVAAGGQSLTYGELERRSNQLAHALRRRGVGPEVRVGVCMERSLEMVIALAAILKAGGAYVPLDPEYPPDRLGFVLEDSAVSLLLCHEHVAGRLPAGGFQRLVADPLWAQAAGESPESVEDRAEPRNLAYVIYTSGSTGRPKGVMVTHENVVRLFRATDAWFGFGPADVWTLFHSYAFDFSVWEMWGALLYGGRLVVVPYLTSRDPEELRRLLAAEGVTVLNQTPSAFRQLARADLASGEAELSLRLVIFGGEALEPGSLRAWVGKHGDARPRLVNMYGITETTVHVTCRPITRADAEQGSGSPIGVPIPDLAVRVLDRRLQAVPAGVAGEMYVGGAGVARGYLNRPALTAERFVPDPLGTVPGARLYRSGDGARLLSGGGLEYLGRLDGQVKIRGFRVEPGEVEAALRDHPGVREAVVAVWDAAPGDRRLVAYLVPAAGAVPPAELRGHLAGRLPEHMVPGEYVALDAFPRTPSGKLDRRALPEPQGAGAGDGYLAPRTPAEERVAELFAAILGVRRVGVRDDFFALGGHSLLATSLAVRVREALGVEIPLHAVFGARTVGELAVLVEELRGAEAPPIPRAPRGAALPLSSAQERLWFLDRLDPGRATYNMPVALRLTGALDAAALEGALRALAARHETLRTTFAESEGRAVQVIHDGARLALLREDLGAEPPDTREGALRERLLAHAYAPFDLREGPLFQPVLLRLDEGEHMLLLRMHHIIGDGWSTEVLRRELAVLYGALARGERPVLPDLSVQYADYAVWQREQLSGERLRGQLAYWVRRLEGAPPVLELPTDRPRPAAPSHRGAVHPFQVDAATVERLRSLARAEGATLFMVLLAAFQVLLSRYGGSEDVVVGTPVAGRTRAELEGVVGFFANTLALRADLAGNPSFRALVRQVRRTTLRDLAHQEVPWERVVEALAPERSRGRNPLFQVMFALRGEAGEAPAPGPLRTRPEPLRSAVAKFDLTLSLEEAGGGLAGGLEYSTDLFEEGTAARMLRHFRALLDAVLADPEAGVREVPLQTAEERRRVLGWGSGEDPGPTTECVLGMFEAQARRTPDAQALVCGAEALTYAGLDRRANALAHLLRGKGVGPEVRVGVCVEHSPGLVVALLATWKAGGVYVPLDPATPAERLGFLARDAALAVVVATSGTEARLPPGAAEVVLLDERAESPAPPATAARAGSLAYVMYTSGSTGIPKGVMVGHGALAAHVTTVRAAYGITAADRVLQFAAAVFDPSLEQILSALVCGAAVMLRPREIRSAAELARAIAAEGVTVANLPTAYWQQAAAAWAAAGAFQPHRLRLVIAGGERMSPEAVAVWRRGPLGEVRLLNAYGPTETTITATLHELPRDPEDAGARVPIGGPLPGRRAYVLDAAGEPVPAGVPGELCLGGAGVARGYLGRPGLTAERFVPDPFSPQPGARMYRTGDRARWRRTGVLEFLGRDDAQEKVRGFRIEPGEIESALCRHPGVAQAAVVVRGDGGGERRLVGYVVARGEAPRPRELREWVRERLPEHMVPAAVVVLDALPLTPTGKVDRRRLPAPEVERTREYLAPRDALEQRLLRVWEEVLGTGRVGVTDNFFDAGGHSLAVLRLLAAVERLTGRRVPVATLLAGPTVEQLARALRTGEAATAQGPLVPIQPAGAEPPLFFVHSAGGEVVSYAPLARHLGSGRPFYGLQSRGVQGGDLPPTRVEEMAADYLAELRTVQREGPYRLGGWSMGGLVAFEMARRLEAAGEEVELLALVDSVAPRAAPPAAAAEDPRMLASFLAHLGLGGARGASPAAEALALAPAQPLGRVWEDARAAGLVPGELGFADFERLWTVFRRNAAAAASYRPGPCASDLLLVVAGDRAGSAAAEAARWGALTTGTVRSAVVPGNHFTLVREPHVRTLAALLAEALAPVPPSRRAGGAGPGGNGGRPAGRPDG